MQNVTSNVLRVAIVLAGLCVSSGALAGRWTTHTTPFGSSAVEIYMGFRTDTWREGHTVLWKRKSDGKCKSFVMPDGHNEIIGSSKDDLMKVIATTETISCLGGETYTLAPSIESVVFLHVKGGSGNDIILLAEPTWDAEGENGDDLLVVVDSVYANVNGGRGNDTLESWSSHNGAELWGADDNDCLYVKDPGWPFMNGGNGADQCNFAITPEICEAQTTCCLFGAFMGVCQP